MLILILIHGCLMTTQMALIMIILPVSYFSNMEVRFWAICIGYKNYICLRRGKGADSNSIQLHVLNNDINFHYKRYLFNVIPWILAEKIINYLKIKAYCAHIITDTDVLKLYPGVSYEQIYVCDK